MSGSLDEIRAQIAAEEAAKLEADNQEAPEVEEKTVEDENDDTTDKAEGDEQVDTEDDEVDSIDLTLDDEPQVTKPTPEQALVFKLTKEKKKRKEASDELEKLKAENEALRQGQQVIAPTQAPVRQEAANQYSYPPVPLLYENGVNTPEQYQQAYMNWSQECRNIDQQRAQQDTARVNASKETEARAHRLAERSTKFIQENKIKADVAIDTIQDGVQGLQDVLGVEGAALDMLDTVGDGSDKLAYYLGKNPDALTTVKKLFEDDPRGFKVATWLTKTALKLNRSNTKISKAPEPDEALRGDGSTATANALQKQYDAETDWDKLRQLKAKAKDLGITLK